MPISLTYTVKPVSQQKYQLVKSIMIEFNGFSGDWYYLDADCEELPTVELASSHNRPIECISILERVCERHGVELKTVMAFNPVSQAVSVKMY
ncbi:hypothetical protein [Mucilaginibacter agri]|uniref:hypothetical protein n=1 Tax=Mucilaginibacter agri TaxID=2695265 RepID=UPI001AA1960D|nr:hypothetical protein [Mucilaginibacter agri]